MNNSVAVLQARTNSSRLPAKVLLPINGIPLVVLAAKRAANRGRKVIVATSYKPSDDALAKVLGKHTLECFRGSLNNTLKRIVNALSEYDNRTIVFRLTADNVFPDGLLLDEIEEEFLDRRLEYLCCNGIQSGLPYGLSVEVMYLESLRDAYNSSADPFDQEHVTPSIIRKYGKKYFQKYKALNKGNYRCTIDTIDDYFSIAKIFENIKNPISIPSLSLVSMLDNLPYVPSVKKPLKRLVLGAAQLGMAYGVANESGQPSQIVSSDLVRTAISNGIEYIDTAYVYGNSEEVVKRSLSDGWGSRVNVITKLSPLIDCPVGAKNSTIKAFVDASIYKSCLQIGVKKLDVLMLHRVSHLTDWNGLVWDYLLELKELGVIGKLGVSAQNPKEVERSLSVDDVSFIQMPFNLLDWRWRKVISRIISTKQTRNLIIHVRSVFLQGLLLSDNESYWVKANTDNYQNITNWLDYQVTNKKRINRAELCIGYVSAMDWIDGLVIGMETMQQLNDNMFYFEQTSLTTIEIQELNKSCPIVEKNTLDPSLWKVF